MRRALRTLPIILCILVLPLVASGCSKVRGDKDVDTSDGEGAMGKGPGLLTGKRGGVIIYQR